MTAPRKIVLASRNPGKVREIRAVLGAVGVEVAGLDDVDPDGAIPSPPEDEPTFVGNARAKAAWYARATGLWALADDSGLVVDALGGAPGVRSARYAADECPAPSDRTEMDAANNRKLLRELAGVPEPQRTARFVCALAVSDGHRIVLEAAGTVEGRIAAAPAGKNGFGYDPLFLVAGLNCTAAELSPERKNEISHRGRAVRELARLLRDLPPDGGKG
ncbi:MAG: RdgB/HAM1 family non-canonical purine NTP pyrophosphatase [Planctomycetota bacterium]|jgi:XTP/dITP diphosphohydrolase